MNCSMPLRHFTNWEPTLDAMQSFRRCMTDVSHWTNYRRIRGNGSFRCASISLNEKTLHSSMCLLGHRFKYRKGAIKGVTTTSSVKTREVLQVSLPRQRDCAK